MVEKHFIQSIEPIEPINPVDPVGTTVDTNNS
jgi:hypothetical protein